MKSTVQALRDKMEKQKADNEDLVQSIRAGSAAELRQLHLTIQEVRDLLEKKQQELKNANG